MGHSISPSLFMGCQSKRGSCWQGAPGPPPRTHPQGPSLGHWLVCRCESRAFRQVSAWLHQGTSPGGAHSPGQGGRGSLPLQPPGCFKHSVSLGEKVKYVGVQRSRPGTPAAIATVRAYGHPSLHVAGPQCPRLEDVHQHQGLVRGFKAEGSYCRSTGGCVNMGGASGCLSGWLGEAQQKVQVGTASRRT